MVLMVESVFVLLVTMCSGALLVYWLRWACLLLMTDAHTLHAILESECKWAARSYHVSAQIHRWLDRLVMAAWHLANRPLNVGFNYDFREDAVSALCRLAPATVMESKWFLTRSQISD